MSTTDAAPDTPLLDIRGLRVAFEPGTPVLDGIDLQVRAGELLGVIGETGSGKTTLARAVVGLAPVTAGRITVDGHDRTALRGRQLRDARRAGAVQYMFQDPLRSLDPDLTVLRLVGQPLAVAGVPAEERRRRVLAALDQVGLDHALAGRRPGQLSGGQRQRVALARAIVTRPRLLLADEPVSALDASNRNHVLRLLDRLRGELGLAVVLISHDLDSLAGVADRLAVLYRGRIVESGPTDAVLRSPLHPYTALLAASAPGGGPTRRADLTVLRATADRPPTASGCAFAHRCPFADATCAPRPDQQTPADHRTVACHRAPHWRTGLAA